MKQDEREARLLKLQKKSNALEPKSKERGIIQSAISACTENFLNDKDRKAYTFLPNPNYCLTNWSEEGQKLEDVLSEFDQCIHNSGLDPTSPAHFGYIPGGGLATAAWGDFLAAVSNRYSGVFFASPQSVRLENLLISWVAEEVIGYEKGYGGNHTSGGSMATLIAISAARHAQRIRGSEYSNHAIYLTKQSHHSFTKAMRILGLEEMIIREVGMDENYRMRVDALEQQLSTDVGRGLKPFIIQATAGTTDLGVIDPMEEASRIAKKYRAWFHVDAAYGGFFRLTSRGQKALIDLKLADSIVLDPHKGMFLPYGSGMVFTKNINHLKEVNSYQANYMQDTELYENEVSPADLSPELSRPFRALRMWLPLKLHGIGPFRAALEEKLLLAEYFFEEVQKLGFKCLCPPQLSVVAFWYPATNENPNDFNRKLQNMLLDDGKTFISTTTINGQFLLRFAVLNFRSHLKQVDEFLKLLKEKLDDLK